MKIRDPLDDHPLDWTYKGVPAALLGLRTVEVANAKAHLFSAGGAFPVAVLRGERLARNSQWMSEFVRRTGVRIAPHGKTTMAPSIFRRQMEDGAWGITAATFQHVQAYRRFGLQRIFMANLLIGDAAIAWVLDELERDPEFEFYALVDSCEGVEAIARLAGRHSGRRPLRLLVEMGRAGGRAGVRSIETGMDVARAIASAGPRLELAGVETFEGVFQVLPDGQERAQEMLNAVVDLTRRADAAGLFADGILLSAGGSSFYDLTVQTFLAACRDAGLSRTPDILIRSGCYLTHDHGIYREQHLRLKARSDLPQAIGYELEPALEVWAQVLSHPEPGRWIIGMGKRDVGYDAGLPTPLAWARCETRGPAPMPTGYWVSALNDQHAFLDGEAGAPFGIGDLIGFGISHPCTTFDRWRALLVVDEAWIVTDVIRSYF